MDLQAKKLKLIEWILRLGDENLIRQLEAISNADMDWWEDLAPAEKSSIEKGLTQANQGQLKSHEEVMQKYRKWL